MFATTSRDKESIGICCIHRHAKLEMSDRERGIQFCKKNRTLYPVLFFYIATLHVYMLVVLGYLINQSKFSFHLLYTHTKHKWILHVQDYYSLKISEKNFTALNRQYYFKGQNITNQLLHIKITSTRLFLENLIRITKSYCQSTSSLSN